ncbi:MAG: DegT/DnrJ/EryC1/StrS family aminotransferase [Acidobacteriales bacterium]|nr:DegT/DnrJ/EryC1/StrS family aminotransferase [Terriglobales bacterium]
MHPLDRPPAAEVIPLAAVPLLDLQRQYAQIKPQVIDALERVCASQHFILGAEVEALEQEIAAYTGATAAVACASGTDALWLALVAAGVKPGDSVVTTPFSFFASASAIVRAGATPVFADVSPATLNLDPRQVANLLRSHHLGNVRALLPVHLFGQCADMTSFRDLAAEFGIPLIEDAAQAIGATWNQQGAGSIGAAAAFSFYPTKNLSAYGDAGLVTTKHPELAEHMCRLRNHGSPKRYLHDEMGANSRMDALQAAVLRIKLPLLDLWNHSRQQIAARYAQLLTEVGLLSAQQPSPLSLLATLPEAGHIFHQFVIRAERRDALRTFLTERRIGTEIYYPLPLHLQPCFAYLGYANGAFPEAERAAGDVLALPIFPELTEDEQKWVVHNIAEFYS